MDKINKPSSTDPNNLIERLVGGEEDVSKEANLEKSATPIKEAVELEELKNITGREYKSKDDVIKHISELNKLVGDQAIAEARQKAQEYDRLKKEAEELAGENEMPDQTPAEPSEIAKLREEFQTEQLLRKYPEAESILTTVKAISKAEGLSLKDAYEKHLKDIYAAKLESEKAKDQERNISVTSKQRISSSKQGRIAEAAKQALESQTDEAKQNLVKEVLFSEEE